MGISPIPVFLLLFFLCNSLPLSSGQQTTFYISFRFGNDLTGDGSLTSPLQTTTAILDHYSTASGRSLEVVYLGGTHPVSSSLMLFGDASVLVRAFSEEEDGGLPGEFEVEQGVILFCDNVEAETSVFSLANVSLATFRQLRFVDCHNGLSIVNMEPLEGPPVRLTVANCSFVGGVGAISMSLGVELSAADCTFERLAGTAIRGLGKSSFDIARSYFEKVMGGAVLVEADPLYKSRLSITNSKFVANVNTIIADSLTGSGINGCYFERNYGLRGGVLYLKQTNFFGITSSYFNRNSAQAGGVLFTTRTSVLVRESQFIHNGASMGGVGFLGGAAVFKDCVFKFNFASDYGGGVVYVVSSGSDAGSARFESCEISCNKAPTGGVAASFDSLVSFTSCYIFHNQATTAIQNNKNFNITTLPPNGGVVMFSTTSDYPNFGSVEFSSCTVAFNSANEGDGGVAWMDGYKPSFPEAAAVMEMQDSAFIGNSAGGAGGVASTLGVSFQVHRSEFRDITAREGTFWHCRNHLGGHDLIIQDSPLSAQGADVFSCETSSYCTSPYISSMCDCEGAYDSCNTCGGSSDSCPFPTLPEDVDNNPQQQNCTLEREKPGRNNVTLGNATLRLFDNPEFELFSVNSTIAGNFPEEDLPRFKLRYRKFEEFEFGEKIATTDLDDLEKSYTVSEAIQNEEYNINYTSLFSNGMIFQASNWLYSQATNLSFGAEHFIAPPNSLKFTLDVNYPFFRDSEWMATGRTLKIWFAVEVVNHPDALLSANITKTLVVNGSERVSEITFTSVLATESARAKAVLTASFISTGLIDGRRFSNVTVAYEGDFQFSVTTGYCPVNFVFDPNFSTLIEVFEDGGESEEGESREEDDSQNFGMMVGVTIASIVAVLAFVGAGAAGIYIAKKKKKAQKERMERVAKAVKLTT